MKTKTDRRYVPQRTGGECDHAEKKTRFAVGVGGAVVWWFVAVCWPASGICVEPMFHETFESQASIEENGCDVCRPSSFDPGLVRNAAYFGFGSDLTYPDSDNIDPNQGTMLFWVKLSNMNSNRGFMEYGPIGTRPSFGVFFDAGQRRIFFEVRASDGPDGAERFIQHSQEIPSNTGEDWIQLALVWRFNSGGDTDRVCSYINGEPVGQTRFTPSGLWFEPLVETFRIGRNSFHGSAFAHIDELKIYDFVMDEGEIRAAYRKDLGIVPPPFSTPKGPSTGPVRVTGGGLTVHGQPFTVKGVGYQPTPVGETFGFDFFVRPEIYNRDFVLLRAMNANTVRTWAKITDRDFLDAAYNDGSQPIYIAMGFFIPTDNIDYADPDTVALWKSRFRDYVSAFHDHEAVLMWVIGNENNLHYELDDGDWYRLANELAKVAFEVEGAGYHPVAIVNGDLEHVSSVPKHADDQSLDHVDIWGVNAYRAQTLESVLNAYPLLSAKPLWISEFGTDAFNNRLGEEDEDLQADHAERLWCEIINSPVTIGGTVMEYSDEWQKDVDPANHESACRGETIYHPDRCSNEEWYGVVSIREDPSGGPDILTRRKVYATLQEKFAQPRSGSLGCDFNLDGVVALGDLGILIDHLGAGDATYFMGDADGNGTVALGDLGVCLDTLGVAILPEVGECFTEVRDGHGRAVIRYFPDGHREIVVGPNMPFTLEELCASGLLDEADVVKNEGGEIVRCGP